MAGGERAAAAQPDQPRSILLVVNGNPLSRDAVTIGHELLGRLRTAAGVRAEMLVTEFAGHGRQVAEQWAGEHPDGVIVGVGGDGTLNDIANGILAAMSGRGARTTLAVYPAGNANDQFRSWPIARTSLVENAGADLASSVDVLELAYRNDRTGESGRRYALSYVAVGLLATAASILNGRRHNALTNLLIVPLTLRRFKPVTVEMETEEVTVASLSWHIVAPMSKYLKISSNSRRDDGLMEVVTVAHRRRLTWLRILRLASRAVIGLGQQRQSTSAAFHWENGGAVQLDGETVAVPAGSDVVISCLPGAIRMLCCRAE